MGTRWVAFIRAVMVGREGLDRTTLLDAFTAAGAGDPRSHLATGNVSFDLEAGTVPDFTEAVDRALSDIVGRDIEVFVRTLDELRAIDPEAIFARSPIHPTQDRLVTFFREAPDLSGWELPKWLKGGRVAVFHVDGREVYSTTQLVDGQTSAPGGVLEQATRQRATTRAWSTVERILRAHD